MSEGTRKPRDPARTDAGRVIGAGNGQSGEMTEVTPGSPNPDSSRPTRRVLFLRFVLLFVIAISVFFVIAISVVDNAIMIYTHSDRRDPVNREDRWRFEAMPASEDGLLAWSRSQPDLRNFRPQRVPGNHELVLRYERNQTEGPAHPDWDILGYRMAYLVSAPSLQPSHRTLSLWLDLMLGCWLGWAGVVKWRSLGKED
jgi:hypothetical protein